MLHSLSISFNQFKILCTLGMRKIFETSIMSSIDTSNLKHRCAKYIDQKISIFFNIDISKKKE
jgi:hypothetical protein